MQSPFVNASCLCSGAASFTFLWQSKQSSGIGFWSTSHLLEAMALMDTRSSCSSPRARGRPSSDIPASTSCGSRSRRAGLLLALLRLGGVRGGARRSRARAIERSTTGPRRIPNRVQFTGFLAMGVDGGDARVADAAGGCAAGAAAFVVSATTGGAPTKSMRTILNASIDFGRNGAACS